VPRGQVYDDLDERGGLFLPVPVAPTTADDDDADEEAGTARAGSTLRERAGSTLREIDAAALFRRRAPSDADREPLEMDLTKQFYRTLYDEEELAR